MTEDTQLSLCVGLVRLRLKRVMLTWKKISAEVIENLDGTH